MNQEDPSARSVALPALSHSASSSASRTIVVNGREHRVAVDRVTTTDIVAIAYPGLPSARHALSVAFGRGPTERPDGLLAEGQFVRVVEGQTFNVSRTDKS